MTPIARKLRALVASRPILWLGIVAAVAAVSAFSCNPTIPSPDSTIWGCYSRTDGHLIVIDHEAGETCPSGFSPLNWQGSIPGPPQSTTVVPSTAGTTTVPITTTTTGNPPTTATTAPNPPTTGVASG
jgi:hypothetical protein